MDISKGRKLRCLLFLCAYNLNRSPTAEDLVDGVNDYEAESAGVLENAQCVVSQKMLDSADIIFFMEKYMIRLLRKRGYRLEEEKVKVLNIPDKYFCMQPELVEKLRSSLAPYGIKIGGDKISGNRV